MELKLVDSGFFFQTENQNFTLPFLQESKNNLSKALIENPLKTIGIILILWFFTQWIFSKV